MHLPCPATGDCPAPGHSSLSRGAIALFAAAAGMSVANVYYAQPLLDTLAADFAIARAAIGGVVTATQAGCALALLLLVPLGDLVERRRLILAQALLLVAALLIVALAQSSAMLLAAMFLTGLLGTAMTQGLIAYAASAAHSHERGSVVGSTQAGVFLGVLLARSLAGAITDVAGWRGVYVFSSAAMLMLMALMWRALPAQPPSTASRLCYRELLASMFRLLVRHRILQVRGMLALLMFAAFNVFWSALALPLSAAPFGFSHSVIGAFGLVGALGAGAASLAGRLADRGLEQKATAIGLLLLVVAWLPLSLLHLSLAALVIGIVLLDLGAQAIHVTNQSMIFRSSADAHGRLVGAYMLFYAVGSGVGAMGTTLVYAQAGWSGVCLLGAGISVAACLFWACSRECAGVPR